MSRGGRAVAAASLEPLGRELQRPECVLGSRTGHVFVSDWRGGVTMLRPDGSQQTWIGRAGTFEPRPNGIALTRDGTFLIAHLGDTGGIWELGRDERLTPRLTEIDGLPLPPTNFVTLDERGRTWISVSTRRSPRQQAWRTDVADGFIALLDDRGPRIVADGLHYTNEVRPDPSGEWLYAVETFGRRLVRFPVRSNGELGTRETVVTLGEGCFPDGFAFDETGGIWITSLVSNRLLRLRPDGRLEMVIEELDQEFVSRTERAFAAGTMHAEHLGPIPGTRLQHVTSVAFGGPDRRSVYLGSLHNTCIHRFRAPVAGARPTHWRVEIP